MGLVKQHFLRVRDKRRKNIRAIYKRTYTSIDAVKWAHSGINLYWYKKRGFGAAVQLTIFFT